VPRVRANAAVVINSLSFIAWLLSLHFRQVRHSRGT
jgi:hypothetical protein